MNFRGLARGAFAAAFGLSTVASWATDLTGGLVVVRMGDGTTSLNTSAAPIFLDKFSTLGVKDVSNTVALPTVTGGGWNRITTSGSAASTGYLNLSANNQFLMVAGYDAAVGTLNVVGTNSAAVNRVVGRVSLDGNVDTTTLLSDAFSGGGGFRSVASDDGYHFWMTGDSNVGGGGVRYANIGSTTSTQVAATPNNTRLVGIYNNQLYMSSGSAGFVGVNQTGTGLPTTSGQTNTFMAGVTGQDPYDFLLFNPSTLYVADNRNTSSGGLYKYELIGSTWTNTEIINYVNPGGSPSGLRSLTTDGTKIYAVSGELTTRIVAITDGPTNTVDVIASADANTTFRGIRWVPNQPVPEPASICALGLGALAVVRRKRKR